MSTEDLEFLKEHREALDMATSRDYIRGVPTGIASRYFEIADREGISHGSISCHKCVFDVCKALGLKLIQIESKEASNINLLQDKENSTESPKINEKTVSVKRVRKSKKA